MKQISLFILLIGWLAACTNQQAPVNTAVTPVQIQRLNADYAVGTPRVSFALFDGPEPLANVAQVEISTSLVEAAERDVNEADTLRSPASAYDDYEIPYWVVYPDLTQPGIWGVTAHIQLEDGTQLTSQFLIEVAAKSKSVPLQAAAPASQNRTLATEPDLNKLSSGNEPNPALYQMTVAEALETDKPTVIAFATPGLCQTKWCTPVLESIETVQQSVGENANFIHIEVYEDFQNLTLVPEMAEWGLQTEPWVYVLAANGRVSAKFGGPLSPDELSAALTPLLP